MAKKRKEMKPQGNIRRSQLITTFGPGSMMDLPDHSVLIAGLDHWKGDKFEVIEDRLLDRLMSALDVHELKMFTPPAHDDDPSKPLSHVVAWQFPEWFVTQKAAVESDSNSRVRSRRLVHRSALTKSKFIDSDRKKQSVVPVRFVRACPLGHIGDIDWPVFCHENKEKVCARPMLWWDELDTSGDMSSIQVRCQCGVRRRLKEAAGYVSEALGKCDGRKLWLGPRVWDQCNQKNRLLNRTASNAYFAQRLSAISLPKRNETISNAVDQVWQFLEAADSVAEVKFCRKMAQVKAVIEDFSDDEIWAEIESRREGGEAENVSIRQPELETLIASKEEIGTDKPDGDFFARSLPDSVWSKPWMSGVEKVVLVHRLREVIAQIGFTRFEPPGSDLEEELDIGVVRATLARETTWVPAIENRGEGVFIQFNDEAIESWAKRKDVQQYGTKLLDGFELWKSEHKSSSDTFRHLPYYMLHSLAHLLITTISLECGYPASSIKERIYALDGVGYGVLLYTGSPDAEGTLGGLVQTGRRIHHYIRKAIEFGQLCSNDPICACHNPKDPHERRFLHGAACHGCLLISETSCERFNSCLDRNLVVPTLENAGVEFFKVD